MKIHINNDNNYATPPDLYKIWDEEFRFDFDPCPYDEGEITPDKDGLLKEWGNSNYVNPPYTQALKEAFVRKAVEESRRGKRSVLLLPVSTSTSLFHDIIKPNAKEIRFLKKRIVFGKINAEGKFYIPLKNGKKQSGTKDSMLVII